jgi:ribosomal protein S21
VIKVERRENESFEKMFKRFKKKCERENLNKDMRKTEYYESPSERRRRNKRKRLKEFDAENAN